MRLERERLMASRREVASRRILFCSGVSRDVLAVELDRYAGQLGNMRGTASGRRRESFSLASMTLPVFESTYFVESRMSEA